ncbi:MAG: hypothetical protein ACREAG_06405 [Nitrosopumilaceae archaeon]
MSISNGKVIAVVNFLDIKSSVRPPENEYSIFNFEQALKNYQAISGNFAIDILDYTTNESFSEIESDMGILESWRTGVNCFGARIYSGAVLFASVSTECVLNHDLRLEKYRQKANHEWLDLTVKNLKSADDNGLPTKLLLEPNETFLTDITFVRRRNKVAHGDKEGYQKIHVPKKIEFGITYTNTWEPTREQALDQIEKAKNFIIEWAKQSPEVRVH